MVCGMWNETIFTAYQIDSHPVIASSYLYLADGGSGRVDVEPNGEPGLWWLGLRGVILAHKFRNEVGCCTCGGYVHRSLWEKDTNAVTCVACKCM